MSINLISGEITAAQIERFDSIVSELELLFAGHTQSLVHNHRPLFPVSVGGAEFDRDLALYDNTMCLLRRVTTPISMLWMYMSLPRWPRPTPGWKSW